MNTNSSPISGLRNTCINYISYENVFLITLLISENNSHVIHVQSNFTFQDFYIKAYFDNLKMYKLATLFKRSV